MSEPVQGWRPTSAEVPSGASRYSTDDAARMAWIAGRIDHGPPMTREELLEARRFLQPLAEHDLVGYTRYGLALVDARLRSLETGEPVVGPAPPLAPAQARGGRALAPVAAVVAVVVLAVAGLVIALTTSSGSGTGTGGAAGAAPMPWTGRPTAPATEVAQEPVDEDSYDTGLPALADDESVDGLAESICRAFDRGMTESQAESVLTDAGVASSDAGQLVYLAVAGYCPEHLSLVD